MRPWLNACCICDTVAMLVLFPVALYAGDATMLRINPYGAYQTGQQTTRLGVIDPYTGQFMDVDSFSETDYSAPLRSYGYAQQDTAANSGLSYQVSRNLTLNLDPVERRLNTDLNFSRDKKKRFKLRVNSKGAKVLYVYGF